VSGLRCFKFYLILRAGTGFALFTAMRKKAAHTEEKVQNVEIDYRSG
jgi:hypothetical protein